MNEKLIEAYRNQPLNQEEIEKNLLPMQEEKESKILEYYKNTAPQRIIDGLSDEALERYLKFELGEKIKKYDELLDIVMKQYIKISEQKYLEVENIYEQIDFITANKTLKLDIYNNIHIKQRKILNFIKDKAWHFREYYDSKDGNKAVMLMMIMEVQKEIFDIDEKSNIITVYNNYKYNIDCELESLRTKIYKVKQIFALPLKEDYKNFCIIKNNNCNYNDIDEEAIKTI